MRPKNHTLGAREGSGKGENGEDEVCSDKAWSWNGGNFCEENLPKQPVMLFILHVIYSQSLTH